VVGQGRRIVGKDDGGESTCDTMRWFWSVSESVVVLFELSCAALYW
jgi:hypothetical protein